VEPTVLVDLDLFAPAVAAHVNADPTRNLYMLAHGDPASTWEWERAFEQEIQPLTPHSPHGKVLCGVPKAEMHNGLSGRFVERLVAELRYRYQYVILDVGAFRQSGGIPLQWALAAQAGQLLLVTSADIIGLSHARTALAAYRGYPDATLERVALVVNRHDRRYHYGRNEIEWALGVGAAAVVPFDHRGVARSLAAQRPLVLDGHSRAGRAILALADRLHGGSVLLPPEPTLDRLERQGLGTLAALLNWPAGALRRLWPSESARPATPRGAPRREREQGPGGRAAALESRENSGGHTGERGRVNVA
jgi:MinD-like ATPase involved in chromosome partitioning or flagellar assembly